MKGKYIIVAIVIIAVIFTSYMTFLKRVDHAGKDVNPPVVSKGILKEFNYCRSGGMENSLYDLTIAANEDGSATITLVTREGNGGKEVTKTKKVDGAFLASVEAIIEENHMETWKNLPKSEIEALDAPDTYVTCKLKDETLTWKDSDELPAGGWKAIRSIVSLAEAQL